jgi:hypothetical protein
VRVVAGSNPATPTKDKSFIFQEVRLTAADASCSAIRIASLRDSAKASAY